jgi:NADH-quinone oxidoreductase subunit F
MLEIVTRICEGKGQEGDIEKLIELGNTIKDTALCGLGQTAPNPVLSTIRYFRDEYEAHIRDKHCPADVCPALTRAPCQSACPAGVDVPGFVSLIAEKRYAEALALHREKNPFASVCARVCFHTCEDKCRRGTVDDAVAIRNLKRFMTEQEVTVQLPEVRDNEENAKRKIAIIGAGPAGLSCAYFLARLGYRPKVLEAEARPGWHAGADDSGIPAAARGAGPRNPYD